jgi:hypothetical protein
MLCDCLNGSAEGGVDAIKLACLACHLAAADSVWGILFDLIDGGGGA